MAIKDYIGTKDFYKMALKISLPVYIQNLITNFVSLLDNIMVGRIGTAEMSGVSIVNTLIFVFNLFIFGAVSGPGIFSAQFHGQGNHKGVRSCLRYKLLIVSLISLIGISVTTLLYEPLINMYLHDADTNNVLLTFNSAKSYMFIMAFGFLPFGIANAYSGTLRETGETSVPMKAGIVAVTVNLIFNYLLIYGKFGFPRLGVEGAAIATILSRFVEMIIIVIYVHKNKADKQFAIGLYKSFKIPLKLFWNITKKGLPLVLNEGLWAAGLSVLVSLYSTRGLAVVAGYNIANVIINLFNVGFIAFSCGIAIILGNLLGAGKLDEAKSTSKKLIALTVAIGVIMGIISSLCSGLFPLAYNTTEEVRHIATMLILVAGITAPIQAYLNAAYFTIRSGGNTVITMLFDSVFEWGIIVPFIYVLAYHTDISIIPLFASAQLIQGVKGLIGGILVKKGIWINNLTEKQA